MIKDGMEEKIAADKARAKRGSDGIKANLKMHMALAKGGCIYIWEAEDYPGLTIVDKRETRKDPVVRVIEYDGITYPKIADAVAVAKAKREADAKAGVL